MKWWLFTGVLVYAVVWVYRKRDYELTAAARELPKDKVLEEDINRGRLGDITSYDRLLTENIP
ncbi:MAG TPA: hypothetical protein VF476_11510 [Chitinophagaceae bacterium]